MKLEPYTYLGEKFFCNAYSDEEWQDGTADNIRFSTLHPMDMHITRRRGLHDSELEPLLRMSAASHDSSSAVSVFLTEAQQIERLLKNM